MDVGKKGWLNAASLTSMSVVFSFFACSVSLGSPVLSLSLHISSENVLMNSNGFVYSNMNLHGFFGTQIIPTNHKNVTINELFSTDHEFLDAKKMPWNSI